MFNNIRGKVVEYLHLRFQEIKLEVLEKIVNVIGYLLFTLISIFFFFISTIFLGFGLAEWLSVVFESRIWGYLSTFGIFIMVGVLIMISSKGIIRFFASKMISMITKSKRR